MNSFELYVEPGFEWYFTDWFSFDELLGFYLTNAKIVKDVAEDATSEDIEYDRENSTSIESTSTFSFGNLEKGVEGISPWAGFDKGFEFNANYWHQLYSKTGDYKADEQDYSFGGEAIYAYFNSETALMLRPSVTVTKYLNDKIDESLVTELIFAAARDLSTKLTVAPEIGVTITKPDADTDAENELYLNVDVIINAIEKLEITANARYEDNLSNDDTDPVVMIGLDFYHEIFVKE